MIINEVIELVKTVDKKIIDKKETGKRIKNFRMSKNISMTELAKTAGVSKSLISQVERGEVYPSLQTLEKIADALGVHLSKFFQVEGKVNDNENCFVKSGMQKIVFMPETNNKYYVLTSSLHNSDFEFLIIEYPPHDGKKDMVDYFRHDGKEYFYVLEGELRLNLDGVTYDISQGDSGCFNSSLVHSFLNISDKVAKILIAATNPAL